MRGSLYRNVFRLVPKGKVREVAAMFKAIHAQEDRAEAIKKAESVSKKLAEMKLKKAAELVRQGAEETLRYYKFPREHWRQIRTNNPLERIMREIRRRSRVVGYFPDGNSALTLAAARLTHIAGTRWGTKQYMNMKDLQELEIETIAAAGWADKKSPPPWGWLGRNHDQMKDLFQNVRKIPCTT
jgi:transposase-like protein